MRTSKSTADQSYTTRLISLEHARWKKLLNVQRPYQQNIKRLHPGKTLDIGCGIGRYLQILPPGSVGIDHNGHSVEFAKNAGFAAYTTAEFSKLGTHTPRDFDSLLLSHVLEHMTPAESIRLLREYAPLLKKHGQVIVCCPQEKGYTTDSTHVKFMDDKRLADVLEQAGFTTKRLRSFPFPRFFGTFFTYNEFVVVGTKR